VIAVDLTRVEELIDLMRQSGVTRLSLELPDFKVSITRGPEGTQVETEGGSQPPPTGDEEVEEPARAGPPSGGEAELQGLSVVSPVVGVFHNGGMLDPREVVREGDHVSEGQLLAAIEAMKVPNELRAPVSGVVSKLLVENGAAVEYGQALLLIEPDLGSEASEDESSVGLA
jgi:acetyl-CoA carboxylase biotin carboxyl carrier protein